MKKIKNNILKNISKIVDISIDELENILEFPDDAKKGDIAFPCFILAKKLKRSPIQISKDISEKLPTIKNVSKIESIGPYINFYIDINEISKIYLKEIIVKEKNFGKYNEGKNKNIVIEYSSPNIAKPFHFGHMRTTIIGNFISNIYKNAGYNVISINYLGDWGKQFGLVSLAYKLWGEDEKLKKDPIKYLYELYVRINKEAEIDPELHIKARELFKKMEDGDSEALKYWEKFHTLSISKYKEVYKRMGINFDVFSGESHYNNKMKDIEKILEDKKLLKTSEGAQIIDLEEFKLNIALIKKSDGASLYITRDIAAAIHRKKEYNFHKMIYVVGSEQILHFKQLFKIIELMGNNWSKDCEHITFGRVKGMSTRKGQAVFLEDVLNEGKLRSLNKMKENNDKFKDIEDPEYTSDICGLTALLFSDLSNRRIKDYEFNWDRMLEFEGDTGLYLQNAYARISSIIRKSNMEIDIKCDYSLLKEKEAVQCIRKLLYFENILEISLKKREACTLANYLLEIARNFHRAYNVLRVIGEDKNKAKARLVLFSAIRQVLENGMKILGITPLERM